MITAVEWSVSAELKENADTEKLKKDIKEEFSCDFMEVSSDNWFYVNGIYDESEAESIDDWLKTRPETV